MPLAPDVRHALPHSAPALSAADGAAIAQIVESGWIAQGDAARSFADALRAQHQACGVMLASSGTAGLVLALRALGVSTGDDVVMPSYVCASVAEAIRAVGAQPVLCDVEGWLMTAATVSAALTARTRAVIAVSVFGLACDLPGIAALGVPVIDDRCQAFGLPVNTAAAFSVCSFHATKCLTAGEGGAVLAFSDEHAARLAEESHRSRRTFGAFSDLQAVLGSRQLAHWPAMLARRHAIARAYLEGLPAPLTQRAAEAAQAGSVWFRFPLWLGSGARFEDVRHRFEAQGVSVRRGVDALLHRANGLPDNNFTGTVAAFANTLSLPIWPAMNDDDVTHVMEAVRDVVG
jgi:perosamine synthetase